VRIEEHAGDVAVAMDAAGDRVEGVRLTDGSMRHAGQVVLATGAWSGALAGLDDSASVPVRPVKGQILRLRDPAGAGLLTRAVRGRGVYIVPRDDGRYVVGATMEERGFELSATAGGAYELLRDAHELVPGVAEFQLEQVCVGLRPGTPDNAPLIGRSAHGGPIWACGHFRNGILLAPLTAELVAGVLAGQPADPLLQLCDPARFAVNAPAGKKSAGALLTGVAG
jgi:glycine oxidase